MIAGIIFAALGVEQAMRHLLHGGRLDALGGWTLGGGVGIGVVAAILLASAAIESDVTAAGR